MSEISSAVLLLTRTQHHFSIRYNLPDIALTHWLHLYPDRPAASPLVQLLLHQMEQIGPLRQTGVFYTGGIHHPYLFLFEITSGHLSLTGCSCTPEQAALRFQSCTAPDLSAEHQYTAVMLHRPDTVYRPASDFPLSSAGRHLIRQCLCLEGPDFPEICFRRESPVQWFRLWYQGAHLRCNKLYLIPLCTAHRQVLLLSHAVSPEEMIRCYFHLPAPEEMVLTPREQQTLELAGQGLPNRAIAALLKIQEGTVKKLLSGAYAKLGIHSRYDLFRRVP